MNYLIHVHCSNCEFHLKERSPRRWDILKDGAVLPSMTSPRTQTFDARTTREQQKLRTKEEIAGFCNRCMKFVFVESRTNLCRDCNSDLRFFPAKIPTSVGTLWQSLTGKAKRCSYCQTWIGTSEQYQCGKCKRMGLHGVSHPTIMCTS
jgi:hypothetical protein